MKEQERLTTQANNFTLKREGNIMADGPKGAEQPPRPIEPEKPQEPKVTPEPPPTEEVTPERQEEVRQWAIGYAKEQGLDWNKLPLPVRSAFEQHAKEFGRPGPGAMTGPPEETEEEARLRAAGWIGEEEPERRAEAGAEERTTQEMLARLLGREGERFGFYLQPEDIAILREDPIKWLDQQFDILYRSVQEGQELTSPVVQSIEQVFSEAIRYLLYRNPEKLVEFQRLFIIRLNIMAMRTTVGYRNVESIKSAALKLTAHGLLYGFTMEGGKVGSMFNRLNELLDDQRLKTSAGGRQFGHVTPEIANQLQDNVIQEQIRFAELGLSQFGNLTDEVLAVLPVTEGQTPEEVVEKERVRVKADITRAVRLAYDIFVDTQRQAVIVARGRVLTDTEAYFSDPASGPLNVYNIEDLLTEKFDIFNLHDYEFLEKIKLDLADEYVRKKRKEDPNFNLSHEQRIDLGRRLFRDIFAVPDFFSSGWRVKGILDSIEERFVARFGTEIGEEAAKERAKQMALFLRLKAAGDDIEKRREIWQNIARFRPEEVVRLFRERAQGENRLEQRLNNLFGNAVFTRNDVTNYDQFKERYGVILRQLRDRGYSELRQLNIVEDGFSPEEAAMVNRYLGEANAADELREMLRLMSEFSNNSIEDLLNHNKFEDIYVRTINVDDAILNELEKEELRYIDANGNEVVAPRRFVPLSRKYAADQGGDALVRNWTDTENAVKVAHALVQFIKQEEGKEKLKNAIDMAEATSQYNGQAGRARVIRFTFGTFLNLSKKDYFWDVIGFEKGPLRLPISDIERIYGPSAKPMGRDELRDMVDKISLLLVGSLSKDAREGRLSPEEYKEKKVEAQAMLKDLERLTETTAKDTFKLKALAVLLFLILAMFGEGYKTVESAVKGKAA